MSIKEKLKEPGRNTNITGHEIMALERFAPDTRHMIIFDVLKWECPVGDKDKRVRIFLTDEGYKQALESEGCGEINIIRHAHIWKGDIFFDAPEHNHELY